MNTIWEFIKKYYFIITIMLFNSSILLYQLFKHNAEQGIIIVINYYTVIVLIISILCYYFYIIKKYNPKLIIITALMSYIAISLCYIYSKDKDLKWEGSDVAWNNYYAALELNKYGADYIINTWNARANPYDTTGYIESAPKLPYNSNEYAQRYLNKFHLNWLVGNKWNERDLKVNRMNNRAYMHPPLAPIIMGFWFKFFPNGRWSLEIFMILIIVVSFLVMIFFIMKKSYLSDKNKIITFLAVVSCPVYILYVNPSSEQITTFFLTIGVFFLLMSENRPFLYSLFSGLLLALGFYSEFLISFFISFQIISLFVFYRSVDKKIIVGFLTGFISINLMFIILGYYPWLTVITGFAVSKVYKVANPVSSFISLTKLTYFGIPLLIFIVIMFYNLVRGTITHKFITIPLLFSFIVAIAFSWDLGALNRYASVFLLAMSPFIIHSLNKIDFTPVEIFLIPVSNLLLFCSLVYF